MKFQFLKVRNPDITLMERLNKETQMISLTTLSTVIIQISFIADLHYSHLRTSKQPKSIAELRGLNIFTKSILLFRIEDLSY